MKQHICVKHDGIRYPCDQCGYEATKVYDLKRHTDAKHKNVRFPCDICSFSASNVPYLKKHKRLKHADDKYDGSSDFDSSMNEHKLDIEESHGEELEQTASSSSRSNLRMSLTEYDKNPEQNTEETFSGNLLNTYNKNEFRS